jgi:hypothetical protein
MAGISYVEVFRGELMAIPAEEVREPGFPINYAAGEALTLQQLAERDKDKLSVRKIDWNLVSTLGQRTLALQEAETKYMMAQFGTGELYAQWTKAYNEAVALREELTHSMLYAFDGNEVLLEAVRGIMQGTSYTDLVQDQSDLEGYCIKFKDLLDTAGIDFKLVERAGELKVILGELLAKTNVEKMDKSPEKDLRDRAFTFMDMAVDKIRKCGKSVFWKDQDHAAYYASAYLRKQRRKAEKAKSTKPVTEKVLVPA